MGSLGTGHLRQHFGTRFEEFIQFAADEFAVPTNHQNSENFVVHFIRKWLKSSHYLHQQCIANSDRILWRKIWEKLLSWI